MNSPQQPQWSIRARQLTACWLLGDLQEGYDVYLAEPEPLKEGEEKHVVSVFVADESGLINRVAGVFARRGELQQQPAFAAAVADKQTGRHHNHHNQQQQ
jgi:hypothetical protein